MKIIKQYKPTRMSSTHPPLGLDLDDTITAHPEFFSWLSCNWPGEVYIITARGEGATRDPEENDLAKHGIAFTDIIYANETSECKANVIRELGIKIMFDDMFEFARHIDSDVATFVVKGSNNFDPGPNLFCFTRDTGKLIGPP